MYIYIYIYIYTYIYVFCLFLFFSQVLLDFQLAGHKQFLAPFVSLFRLLDREGTGVLSESEFRRLVSSVAPTKTTAGALWLYCMFAYIWD